MRTSKPTVINVLVTNLILLGIIDLIFTLPDTIATYALISAVILAYVLGE